jgi:tRNA 2-thiouridine synthesizing protein A
MDEKTPRPIKPVVLDLRGLNCPLPALRTRKALKRMPAGATLLVECTDPLAAIDIPHCVMESGDALESQSLDGDVLRFLVRRRAERSGP